MALNVADVKTTVKTTVQLGETTLDWVHSWGDMGGAPNEIDVTPTSSEVRMTVAGVIDQPQWTFNYYFTKEGYNAVEAMVESGESVNITVTFKDGDKMTNTGVVSSNYLTGGDVDSAVDAQATVNVNGKWKLVPKD